MRHSLTALAKIEARVARNLELSGASLNGEKIPESLLGLELRTMHGKKIRRTSHSASSFKKNRRGHFLLAGGDHTEKFLDMQLAMGRKEITDDLEILILARLEEKGFITSKGPIFNAVIGPARGAAIVGSTLLRALGRPPNIIELYPVKDSDGVFHCSYPFPDAREIYALGVDDVLTTARSLRKAMQACYDAAEFKAQQLKKSKNNGGKGIQPSFYFIGGLVVVNRAPDLKAFERNTITFPIGYCLRLEAQTWPADVCPKCKEDIPLYKV